AEREQQVGDHGGDAFQQNRLRWGDSRGDQFIKLLPALGGDSDPDGWDYAAMEQAIDDEIGVLIAACQRCPAHVVLVTNEVGMGIVPENRLARHFRDSSLGRLEALAVQLAGMPGLGGQPQVAKKALLVMCADHGVWDEGVAISPKAVTAIQAANMTLSLIH
ncbi:bifunctional adenosylcobinamide kinase/adenosylcobinamide-phosphate guanylyltransferase, partial [Klebsiella pneumoniae]|uniref:bifunctional adenosylcobinamide kinase/adenosylcobinamide-phosphate guanylyltransferase n=1 Tax=Klebsiella pneumoniae TaxID=573 RepID=UPI003EB7A29D